MSVSSQPPTNAVEVIKLADGGACLKLGAGYLTVDADAKLRISGSLPAAINSGDVVGDQTA